MVENYLILPEVLVAAAENYFELAPSLPGDQLACYVLASTRSQLAVAQFIKKIDHFMPGPPSLTGAIT